MPIGGRPGVHDIAAGAPSSGLDRCRSNGWYVPPTLLLRAISRSDQARGHEFSGSGRRENGVVIVDCALYEEGVRRRGELQVGECHLRVHDGTSFIWIGLFEPTEAEFAEVRAAFQLHPLAVEDALKAHQMPKLELYDESVFLVLKTARYLDDVERSSSARSRCSSAASSCTSVTARRRLCVWCARTPSTIPNCCGADRAPCSTPSPTTSSTRTSR